jgi:UPF0716 family protein affecting phage T7 exclusion
VKYISDFIAFFLLVFSIIGVFWILELIVSSALPK